MATLQSTYKKSPTMPYMYRVLILQGQVGALLITLLSFTGVAPIRESRLPKLICWLKTAIPHAHSRDIFAIILTE